MKCRILRHFFWVFTVCRSTPVGISSIERVNNFCFCALSSSDIAEILLAGPDANKKNCLQMKDFAV